MSRLRVCHITTVHKENDNRIFYKECTSLRQDGFHVALLCAGSISSVTEGIQIIGLPKNKNRIFHFFNTSIYHVIKTSLKVKAHIYHFHDPELIFAGLFLRLCGKKVIYDIHENNASSILSKPYIKSKLFKYILSKAFNVFEKVTTPFFSKILTARPDISEKFNYLNPITLRNFPIIESQASFLKVKIEKDKQVVIFVGGLAAIRGIRELINAFESLEGVELWLLGPWASDSFKEECENLKGWKNTRYLGVVEPYEIFAYLELADIGIVTFLPFPNHTRTLATKPFEYMMAGLPMIMSDFKYWKDFFKELSLYVDPTNSLAIAKAINQLLSNPDEMKRMGDKSRDQVQNEFNWQKESQKLIGIYRQII